MSFLPAKSHEVLGMRCSFLEDFVPTNLPSKINQMVGKYAENMFSMGNSLYYTRIPRGWDPRTFTGENNHGNCNYISPLRIGQGSPSEWPFMAYKWDDPNHLLRGMILQEMCVTKWPHIGRVKRSVHIILGLLGRFRFWMKTYKRKQTDSLLLVVCCFCMFVCYVVMVLYLLFLVSCLLLFVVVCCCLLLFAVVCCRLLFVLVLLFFLLLGYCCVGWFCSHLLFVLPPNKDHHHETVASSPYQHRHDHQGRRTNLEPPGAQISTNPTVESSEIDLLNLVSYQRSEIYQAKSYREHPTYLDFACWMFPFFSLVFGGDFRMSISFFNKRNLNYFKDSVITWNCLFKMLGKSKRYVHKWWFDVDESHGRKQPITLNTYKKHGCSANPKFLKSYKQTMVPWF